MKLGAAEDCASHSGKMLPLWERLQASLKNDYFPSLMSFYGFSSQN